MPPQCSLNNLQLPPVPEVLKVLNSIERRLISQVHPYMKLILLPHGQSAMQGQVINFPFILEDMMSKENINDSNILIIQTPGSNAIPKEYKADMAKVRAALLWLSKNNPMYKNTNVYYLPEVQPTIIHLEGDSTETTEMPGDDVPLLETSVTVDIPILPNVNFKEKVCGGKAPPKVEMNALMPTLTSMSLGFPIGPDLMVSPLSPMCI